VPAVPRSGGDPGQRFPGVRLKHLERPRTARRRKGQCGLDRLRAVFLDGESAGGRGYQQIALGDLVAEPLHDLAPMNDRAAPLLMERDFGFASTVTIR